MNEFAALIEMRRCRQAGFGAFGFSLSDLDPTSSRSIFGSGVARIAAPVAQVVRDYAIRPALATGAAMMTGGASVFAAERIGRGTRATFGIRPTAIGAAEGAIVGGIIVAGPAVASAVGGKAVAAASTVAVSTATAAALRATGITPAPATPTTSGSSGTPVGAVTAGDGATSNRAAVLAGLGLGFVAGGPLGAVAGGIVGAIIAARRQS